MKAQVTQESIQTMLNNPNKKYVMTVIGRALVHIFNRQTEDEKSSNTTNKHNSVGFAGCDARSGSMTAKYWLKHGKLEDWQMEKWTKIGSNGFARLCKYHRQLNEVAQQGK